MRFCLFAWLAFAPLAAQTASLEARAAAARDAGRLDEAEKLYREAVAQRPGWAEGWWYLGTLLYDRDDYSGAAGALAHALQLDPRSGAAAAMLGLSEAKLGRNREALEHLAAARKSGAASDPQLHGVLLFTEGSLLLEQGKFGEAQETLDVLAREGVQEPALLTALGCAVLGIRPPPDAGARDIVQQAGWAEHYAAQGDFAAADREYTKLAGDYPKFHDVQFAYGRFLLANHQDDRATAAFLKELQNTPNHLLARLGLAGIQLQRDAATGVPYAQQAVQLAPGLAEAHYLLGALLLETGDTARAIKELETARRLAPGDARTYLPLSRAYERAARKEDAAKARAAFARLNEEHSR